MKNNLPNRPKSINGIATHPEHESWVRIATYNNTLGFVVFVLIAAAFIFVLNLHLSSGELTTVMVLAATAGALLVVWMVWQGTPLRFRGVAGNVVLTSKIKADILTVLGQSCDVDVDSSRGIVSLHGTIPYADFHNAAVDIARRRGARQVFDYLVVDAALRDEPDTYLTGFPGVTTPEGAPNVGATLERVVLEALQDDPRVNTYLLTVRVQDCIAYLEGRQDTVQASEAATEIAAQVPGIVQVSNDIEILSSV